MHDTVLNGRHVTLEPLLEGHAKELADAITPEDDVFLWTNTAPRSETAMHAWILDRQRPRAGLRNLAFAQRSARTGRLMGSTSLFDLDEAAESVEIGHTWLAAPYRRTGANTEAKLLLLTHAFDVLRLKRVQIVTDVRNERSQRAIVRLGATREGVLRNHRRDLAGKLRDSAYFSIVDREWGTVKSHLEAILKAE